MLRWYALLLFIVARYQRPGRHERTVSTPYVFWVQTIALRLARDPGRWRGAAGHAARAS